MKMEKLLMKRKEIFQCNRIEGVNYFVYSLSLSKIIGLFNFEKMLIKQIKVVDLQLFLSILFPFSTTNIPSK
jgi:hypothetical protein